MCIRASSPYSSPNPNRDAERQLARQQREESERIKNEQRDRRLRLAERHVELQAKKLALRPRPKRTDLVPIRIKLHYADVDFFKSLMLATAMALDPTILMVDLFTNRVPETSGERSIHTFKCFQADYDGLHATARELDAARVATGNDADDLHWRAETLRRNEEAARLRAEEDEDNGRPERLDA